MRKQVLLSVVLAPIACLAFTAPASADFGPIGVNDNFFDPDFIDENYNGACVTWVWNGSNPHNVRQDRKLFFSGTPTVKSADYAICPSAGTFHYYCEPHGAESGGMDGTLRVRPILDGPVGADKFRVEWIYADIRDTGDRFDVRFRVGDGRWRDWSKDTAKDGKTFGKNNKPVDVKPDRTYSFKVRSQKGSNDNRVSDWSPKLTVET